MSKESALRIGSSLRWLAVVIWATAIFLLSHESADSSSERSGLLVSMLLNLGVGDSLDISETIIRKTAHLMMYAVLGMLLFIALKASIETRRAVAGAIALATIYATTDEIHQLFIPGRSGEVRDVLVDGLGACIGVSLVYLITKKRRKRQEVTARDVAVGK